jgi:hypothetical protein
MAPTLRLFLIIFLAMLQLVAPLVHAHTDEKSLPTGLHIPGLELYAYDSDRLASEAVNHNIEIEGIIVGVDMGIKNKLIKAAADLDNHYYLYPHKIIFNPLISSFSNSFSPQSPPFFCRLFTSSHTSRAPPVQYI